MELQALDLERASNQSSNMVEEIWLVLAKARYTEWEAEASIRQCQQLELKYVFVFRVDVIITCQFSLSFVVEC